MVAQNWNVIDIGKYGVDYCKVGETTRNQKNL